MVNLADTPNQGRVVLVVTGYRLAFMPQHMTTGAYTMRADGWLLLSL